MLPTLRADTAVDTLHRIERRFDYTTGGSPAPFSVDRTRFGAGRRYPVAPSAVRLIVRSRRACTAGASSRTCFSAVDQMRVTASAEATSLVVAFCSSPAEAGRVGAIRPAVPLAGLPVASIDCRRQPD